LGRHGPSVLSLSKGGPAVPWVASWHAQGWRFGDVEN